jgi:hypothetical protein
VSRKRDTRYPHAFSKGRGVPFVSEGSWSPHAKGPAAVRTEAQTQAGARAMTDYPVKLDPDRWKVLKVSPTIANLYRGHAGVALICADCLHGVGHRNPGLPDRFRHQWHLTLLELEKKCRCGMCGSRNARVYPWWGDDGGELGLEGPPQNGR